MRLTSGHRSIAPLTLSALVMGAAALAMAIFNFFWPDNGIHGSAGAGIVIASTALLIGAAVVELLRVGPRWLTGLTEFLLVLGATGTLAAAYFLNAWVFMGLLGLAILAWVAHLIMSGTQSTERTMS